MVSRLQNPVDRFFSAMLFIVLTVLKAPPLKQSRKIQLGLGTFANSAQGYNPLMFLLEGKHVSEKYDLPHGHNAEAQTFTAGAPERWGWV